MAPNLLPSVLAQIFGYIANSKTRTRRPGYTYERKPYRDAQDIDPDRGAEDGDEFELSESDQSDEDSEDDSEDEYEMDHDDGFVSDDCDWQQDFTIEDMGLERYGDLIYKPTYTLRPLLLVCKAWHAIAHPMLYERVSFGSDDDRGFQIGEGRRKAIKFAKTLKDDKLRRLGTLVRVLRLATLNCAKDEAIAHARIIELCPDTTSLTLTGYNGYILDRLLAGIAKLRKLTSLSVSRHNLRDWECDGFCSIDELIGLTMDWPHIQSLFFHNHTTSVNALGWTVSDDGVIGADEYEYEDQSEDAEDTFDPTDEWEVKRRQYLAELKAAREKQKPIDAALRAKILHPQPLSCPRLSSIVLRSCTPLDLPHIQALGAIAPNMKNFRSAVLLSNVPRIDGMRRALRTWSGTLEELYIVPAGLHGDTLAVILDDETCRHLSSVKYLEAGSKTIVATSLIHLVSLERLKFNVSKFSELEAISHALTTLPNFKNIELWSSDYLAGGTLAEVDAGLAARAKELIKGWEDLGIKCRSNIR